jgi:hypothetical protein
VLRKPNISSAAVDLASAAVALGLGFAGAPPFGAGLVFVAAALVWGWTRRDVLARMDWRQRATNGALALGMLGVVLGVLYWIGLTFGGHT